MPPQFKPEILPPPTAAACPPVHYNRHSLHLILGLDFCFLPAVSTECFGTLVYSKFYELPEVTKDFPGKATFTTDEIGDRQGKKKHRSDPRRANVDTVQFHTF